MEGPQYLTFDNLTVHTKQIAKLLQNLNINKALGTDDLPVYTTKLVPVVTAIFYHLLKIDTLLKTGLRQI